VATDRVENDWSVLLALEDLRILQTHASRSRHGGHKREQRELKRRQQKKTHETKRQMRFDENHFDAISADDIDRLSSSLTSCSLVAAEISAQVNFSTAEQEKKKTNKPARDAKK